MISNPKTSVAPSFAVRVILAMERNGVAALPRNYEVYYAAMAGTAPELAGALIGLGKSPSQSDIDEIAERHLAERTKDGMTEKASKALGNEVIALSRTLSAELSSNSNYLDVLQNTLKRLEGAMASNDTDPEKVIKLFGALIDTLKVRKDQGSAITEKVSTTQTNLTHIEAELEKYKALAVTDPLTELLNRRAFDEKLASIYGPNKANRNGTALILMDIDRFKSINDDYGHPVGDLVIKNVAEQIRSALRVNTFVARTGGEEFAIVLEALDRQTGKFITIEKPTLQAIAERVRAKVEQMTLTIPRTSRPLGKVTVSVGVCNALDAVSPADLYTKADGALYAAKEAGRNRVVFHDDDSLDVEPDNHRYLMYSGGR